MIFMITQVLVLLLFICLIYSFFNSNLLKFLTALLGSVFIAMQVSSILLGNALIDFKYYAHIDIDILTEVGGFFFKENLLTLLAFGVSWLSIVMLGAKFNKLFKEKNIIRVLVTVVAIGFMSIPKGVIFNIASISKMHLAKQKEFNEAITNIGFNDFTLKSEITSSAGKNIIAIFMESVEEGYLLDNLSHLTPNLNRLSKEMTYFNMKQNEGSDYTIGAIYTYFTGIPMFFKHHGNDIFEETVDCSLPSITHALDKAGYHQEYIAGNPTFAGADVMMNIMDVEVKSEKDFDSKFAIKHWGLHDKDLFSIVNQELDRLYDQEEPFAYYISTISTHATDGVFDERMTKEFPPQKSQLELMVTSLDKHIGTLMDSLKAKGRLANTSIYIMPDHLLMGNSSRVLKEFKTPRELFLITNEDPESFKPTQSIYQFDVPKLILEGANVKHNLKFLTDIIEGDKLNFIQKNKQALLQLNEASLIRKEKNNEIVINDEQKIELNPDKVQLISNSWADNNEGKESLIAIGLNQLKAKRGLNLITLVDGKYQIEYFDTYENLDEVNGLLERITQLQEEEAYFLILAHDSVGDFLSKKSNEFKELGFPVLGKIAGRRAYLAHANYGYVSESTKRISVQEYFPLIPRKTYRTKSQIKSDAKDYTKLIAHAGGAIDGHNYTNSLEALNASYQQGFRWFELDIIKTSDGHYVANHDWNQWRDKTKYAGAIPVDLATFKSKKILGKYTSMDMEMINDWFRNHPDAIFVSDKVNEPKEFVSQFVDPSRLVMELFSYDAIEEAQKLPLKDILLSEGIWDHLGGNKVKGMKDRSLQSMAISIHTINANREMFKELKDAGIKVYAFHVGNHGLKDEAYMIREGLDFCHGFYADEWQF